MKKELRVCPAIFPMPVILIATYNDDGSVDVIFKCYGNGYEEVKNFKTMAAAKSQVKKFLNKCARIYG